MDSMGSEERTDVLHTALPTYMHPQSQLLAGKSHLAPLSWEEATEASCPPPLAALSEGEFHGPCWL